MSFVTSIQRPSVNIYVKQIGADHRFVVYDKSDECMKAAIVSFKVDYSVKKSGFYLGGNQVRFQLRDLASIHVKWIKEGGTVISPPVKKEIALVACAAESILRRLHQAGCVGKEVITFQARTGHLLSDNLEISDRYIITLDDMPKPFEMKDFEKGFISHSYAYLSGAEKRLCLFMNPVQPKILHKIDSVLASILPRA